MQPIQLLEVVCRSGQRHLGYTDKDHAFSVENRSYVLTWPDVWALVKSKRQLPRIPLMDTSDARIRCSHDGCTDYIEWRYLER